MRELNQHTADVIREINESGKPALITRHGRFVAAIYPLASQDVEAQMVSDALTKVENSGQFIGTHTLSEVSETPDVAQRLGIQLPRYRDRDV